jgi:hypothetical protein
MAGSIHIMEPVFYIYGPHNLKRNALKNRNFFIYALILQFVIFILFSKLLSPLSLTWEKLYEL